MWHLNADVKHPNIVETKFTVVTSEYIQLTLYYIGSVAASWTRSVVTCLNLIPMIGFNIENMNIIHPVNTIVSSKVINFAIDKASCCADSCTGLTASNLRLNPSKSCCIEIKYVVKLAILIRFSSK